MVVVHIESSPLHHQLPRTGACTLLSMQAVSSDILKATHRTFCSHRLLFAGASAACKPRPDIFVSGAGFNSLGLQFQQGWF